MGQSGGRSRNAKVGEAARRRNTPRERQQIDPPWDERVPRYRITPRGVKVREAAFCYGVTFSVGVTAGALLLELFR